MVPSIPLENEGFVPHKRSLQSRGPSSFTRHGWFRLASIDQYSLLLPPVGVGPVSQCPCDWSCSHQLLIVGLVGRYPANCLISRTPILKRRSFNNKTMPLHYITGY